MVHGWWDLSSSSPHNLSGVWWCCVDKSPGTAGGTAGTVLGVSAPFRHTGRDPHGRHRPRRGVGTSKCKQIVPVMSLLQGLSANFDLPNNLGKAGLTDPKALVVLVFVMLQQDLRTF